MRVLVKVEDYKCLETLEIQAIGYDPDLFNSKDRGGIPVDGLSFQDMEGDWFYIKGISNIMCDNICRTIAKEGYAELDMYGGYEYLDLNADQEENQE